MESDEGVPEAPGDKVASRRITVPGTSAAALTAPMQSALSAYVVAMPKFDFVQMQPALDVARLMPKFDTDAFSTIANIQSMLPEIQRSLVPALNIAAALPKVDFDLNIPKSMLLEVARIQETALAGLPHPSTMLAGITSDWIAAIQPTIDVTASLQPIMEVLRSIDWDLITRRPRTPDNWPDDMDEKLPALMELVNQDGIPAAWVPRSEVLDALLSATTGDERSRVLIEYGDEILADCAEWVEALVDPVLEPVLPIAREVLDACRDGHWKVGAISAVQVVHSIVESLHWVSDRQRVAKHHVLKISTPCTRLLEQATRAPLVMFYDDWNPLSGKPRPAHLTRHVVSHSLGNDQVSERNCIVAVMLMASLLVTVYQLDLGQRETAA